MSQANLTEITNLSDALNYIKTHSGITEIELKQLLSQMSVSDPNAKMAILYSGSLTPDGMGGFLSANEGGLQAWQVVNEINLTNTDANGNKHVGIVSNVDASKLLDSQEFKDAYLDALGGDRDLFEQKMKGVINPDGTRLNNGLWDDVSRRFVENLNVAHVKTVSPYALDDSVFSQTELKSLLFNDRVQTIDGLSRADLLKYYTDNGSSTNALKDVRGMISAQSFEDSFDLKLVVDSNGKLIDVGVGERYFAGIDGVIAKHIPDDTVGLKDIGDSYRGMTRGQYEDLKYYSDKLNKIEKISKALDKFGIAGDIADIAVTAYMAGVAYENGDVAQARAIITEWAVGSVAGLAGSYAASAFVSTVLTALAPAFIATPPGAIIAAVVVLGASLAAGVCAGDTAVHILNAGQSMGNVSDNSGAEYQTAVTSLVDEMDKSYGQAGLDYLHSGLTAAKDCLGNLTDMFLSALDLLLSSFEYNPSIIAELVVALMDSARHLVSPIAFDMDGDGVELYNIDAVNVFFDIDNDGFREKVGWIAPDEPDEFQALLRSTMIIQSQVDSYLLRV